MRPKAQRRETRSPQKKRKNTKTATSRIPKEPELVINERYWLTDRFNRKVEGTLLEISSETVYVHYDGTDRRCDEWIPRRCVRQKIVNSQPSSLDDEHENRRATRSQLGVSATKIKPDTEEDLYNKEHEMRTKIKNIELVHMGKFAIEPWYASFYPQERQQRVPVLYVCEHCFRFFTVETSYRQHLGICFYWKNGHHLGKLIYDDKAGLAVFQANCSTVEHTVFSKFTKQLCLFSKLFIDHKTLYFITENFTFYVLCQRKSVKERYTPVGYFSRENGSENNLNCILVFPPYLKRGYGRLLVELSYALSRSEGVIGSPERPLSDQGECLYTRIWAEKVTDYLIATKGKMPITKMSQELYITEEDIVFTLEKLGVLKRKEGSDGAVHLEVSMQKVRQSIEHIKKRNSLFNPAHLRVGKATKKGKNDH